MKLRGILVNTKKGIEPVKFEYNNYKDITELLGCDWITCVSRNIGGMNVDIYCDEEALLKPTREPAIITRDKETRRIIEVLFGNCFICLHNKKGEIKSLPYVDYDKILLTQASLTDNNRTYQVLQCEM
jgi:hypothetical protein